jgi:transcriptional regulator of PTS gene
MNLHAVLIDSSDQQIAKASVRVPASSDNSDIENAIVLLIKQLITEEKYSENLLGVSLSVPGIVNSIEKEWIFSARWPRLRNLSLNNIQNQLGISIDIRRQLDVQLECNMIKEPEYMKGNVLLFHWGYGIGGAFASGGSIIGSSTGVFCQIGHVSVDPHSIKPCICGRLGCLEADAALWALAPEIERTYGQKLEDEVDCINFLASHSIADEIYFKNALTSVVHALCRLIAILVPDNILMYGAFLENDEIFNSLISKTKQLSPPFVAETTQIRRISIGSSWDPRGITAPLFHKAYSEHLVKDKNYVTEQ